MISMQIPQALSRERATAKDFSMSILCWRKQLCKYKTKSYWASFVEWYSFGFSLLDCARLFVLHPLDVGNWGRRARRHHRECTCTLHRIGTNPCNNKGRFEMLNEQSWSSGQHWDPQLLHMILQVAVGRCSVQLLLVHQHLIFFKGGRENLYIFEKSQIVSFNLLVFSDDFIAGKSNWESAAAG